MSVALTRMRQAVRWQRHHLVIGALLILTLVHSLASSHWGVPDGASPETVSSWAVDSIGTVPPLKEAHDRFTREHAEDVGYPLFHYIVLAGAFAPYIAIAWLDGSLEDPGTEYPYGATDPTSFFAHLSFIASLVSALMAAGIVLGVYLVTRELFGRAAALAAMLLAALFPPLGYYGMTSNPDVPYLFWMMLAVWQLLRAARTQQLMSYVLTGVFVSLSAATKDPGAGFFLLLPIVIPWLVARDAQRPHGAPLSRTLLDRRVIGAAVAAVATFALANNLLFGGFEGFQRHLAFADEIYASNIAAPDAAGLLARQPALAAESAQLLVQMIGLATWGLVAVGAWRAVRARCTLALLLPLFAFTYYIAVIVPTITLSRYLFGILFLALPFAGLAIASIRELASRPARAALAVVALTAVGWQLASGVHLHQMLWGDSRFAMAEWVERHVPAGATIESQTQARYLPRLAHRYRYSIVGNSFDAVSYALRNDELTQAALARRRPDYVLVMLDSGVSGDPNRSRDPAVREYFENLLEGRAGYREVARFTTPTWLPYRQITAGTQPTSVLLARN
jgi:Dolichyl-phosphate-mannose-protein mannosyltransferase